MERSERLRSLYIFQVGAYPVEYLVFVDESSSDRRTTYRQRGWALSGERVFRKSFFVRGQRYSILPSLSLSGILSFTVVKGSFTAETFRTFIELTLLRMNPYPGPNSVLIMDNCSIHKNQEVLDMITAK
ncbi:hypothetical protein BDV93DRAFT_456029 [Ceratobasidium sp. AG-I]|nr:hypothetical protein BDV93DRAFT_456029 [Ceratobasidium sp. AG-I]